MTSCFHFLSLLDTGIFFPDAGPSIAAFAAGARIGGVDGHLPSPLPDGAGVSARPNGNPESAEEKIGTVRRIGKGKPGQRRIQQKRGRV